MQSREMMPQGLQEGLELLRARRNEIEAVEGSYSVPDGSETYRVSSTPTGGLSCGCRAVCGPGEDHGKVCSHMWAARLAHAERVAANEAEMGLIDAGGMVR